MTHTSEQSRAPPLASLCGARASPSALLTELVRSGGLQSADGPKHRLSCILRAARGCFRRPALHLIAGRIPVSTSRPGSLLSARNLGKPALGSALVEYAGHAPAPAAGPVWEGCARGLGGCGGRTAPPGVLPSSVSAVSARRRCRLGRPASHDLWGGVSGAHRFAAPPAAGPGRKQATAGR